MIRLSVIFDVNIYTHHVIIDKFTIKAELLPARIVGTCPKGLLHLLFFLCAQLQWFSFDLIEGITATLNGPVHKPHQLLYFYRCIVACHPFRKLSGDSLLHVPLCLINEIYIVRVESARLLLVVKIQRSKLVVYHLTAVVHQVFIIRCDCNLVALIRSQMPHEVLLGDVLHINHFAQI